MSVKVITEEEYEVLLNKLEEISEFIKESTHKKEKVPDRSLEWVTNKEFCEILNIASRTAQNYRDNGKMPFSQIGSKIYYKKSDIDKFLERHYVKGFGKYIPEKRT